MINITASSRYKINRKKIKASIPAVNETVNIVFVGKNKMRQLTQKYKHEHNTLPVLSFPFHGDKIDNETLLGEVIICYPLTILLAAERNKPVDTVIMELVMHGVNNLIETGK